ncbi:hypothetical protein WKT22_01425 [Candidatus Lokiarchaeum ossiferum]
MRIQGIWKIIRNKPEMSVKNSILTFSFTILSAVPMVSESLIRKCARVSKKKMIKIWIDPRWTSYLLKHNSHDLLGFVKKR